MNFLRVHSRSFAVFFLLGIFGGVRGEWAAALPGWRYEFPRDHGDHGDFQTEWWYFTGNLRTAEGREFGYQLTFFRQGVIPPGERVERASKWVAEDVYFAHFAISDLSGGEFSFDQELSRGAFGEAGAGDGDRVAWIGRSEVRVLPDGGFRLVGRDAGKSLELTLRSAKAPVFHGADGVSQKAAGAGRASHYYSLTRLESEGTLTLGDEEFAVRGTSWFDHEWATNQLADGQVGWDWFSLQFEDGTELMVFQIRRRDGGRDEYSGGTFIGADGVAVGFRDAEFSLEPARVWRSPETGADYPVEWRLKVPKVGVDVTVRARMDGQELVLDPISYWEGAVRAEGSRTGVGYLEMTGYAGEIVGMSAAAGSDTEFQK